MPKITLKDFSGDRSGPSGWKCAIYVGDPFDRTLADSIVAERINIYLRMNYGDYDYQYGIWERQSATTFVTKDPSIGVDVLMRFG